jgi:type I restriction enzyme M protein
MQSISETETVIKRIIPYLTRRGYDVSADFTFEYPTAGSERAKLGFVDILVKQGGKIAFLVEAKRVARTLVQRDRKQAVSYGKACKAPFVILTNGNQFESLNTAHGGRIRWDGKLSDKVPTKKELPKALAALRKDPLLVDVPLKDDSLPYRPGLALKQLNALFARCHNIIRKIERNEDHAFSDFAKILFLKLLEEKADVEAVSLPYSYRFHELAEIPEASSDQIKTAVTSMMDNVRKKTPYGDVITEDLHLKNAKSFRKLVIELSQVSFRDSTADSKGAAFEYFVRATLKGKKLGQYFTPRPLIELMHAMVGVEKILNTIMFSGEIKVVDPACGTGGFLVYLMQSAIEHADALLKSGKINSSRRNELVQKVQKSVFFGADAHEGVASSAKMNMIIAGDGHSNIQCQDSLSASSTVWGVKDPDVDLIITNPPFGTSERESITDEDLSQFPVKGAKGQILFLQKMIGATKPGGEICTVIDEGLLNTDQATALRKHILEHARIRAIVRLPDTTFKPNKINVKSSVLHLVKRDDPCPDLDDDYSVFFLDVKTLGYHGSGEAIRGLNFSALVTEISELYHGDVRAKSEASGEGKQWRWFTTPSRRLAEDKTHRFDFKYWDPLLLTQLAKLQDTKSKSIKEINTLPTKRGKSPLASAYVDEQDGYALVVKAGTNITRLGTVSMAGDYIEKNVFDEMAAVHLKDGDVLLSSTGDGTLGKCAVYRSETPAIIDGHVTLIRVDQDEIYPEYLCDYLRAGFGADQIARLYTGSTGLIELPPDQVDSVAVPLPELSKQQAWSEALREAEHGFADALNVAKGSLEAAKATFRVESGGLPGIVVPLPSEDDTAGVATESAAPDI